jgi:hypothetical protein
MVDFFADRDTKSIDFDTIAELFDLDARALNVLFRPDFMCRIDRTLAPFQIVLRLLQQHGIEGLMTQATYEMYVTPFLRHLGYATDDDTRCRKLLECYLVAAIDTGDGNQSKAKGYKKHPISLSARRHHAPANEDSAARNVAVDRDANGPAFVDFTAIVRFDEIRHAAERKALIDRFLRKQQERLQSHEFSIVGAVSLHLRLERAATLLAHPTIAHVNTQDLSVDAATNLLDQRYHELFGEDDRDVSEPYLTEIYLHFPALEHAWLSVMARAHHQWRAMNRARNTNERTSKAATPPSPPNAALQQRDTRTAEDVLRKYEDRLVALLEQFAPLTLSKVKKAATARFDPASSPTSTVLQPVLAGSQTHHRRGAVGHGGEDASTARHAAPLARCSGAAVGAACCP